MKIQYLDQKWPEICVFGEKQSRNWLTSFHNWALKAGSSENFLNANSIFVFLLFLNPPPLSASWKVKLFDEYLVPLPF